MPLKPGKSPNAKSQNISELLHTYKKSGKIGNTTPRSMKHAKQIASAIAYSKARGK